MARMHTTLISWARMRTSMWLPAALRLFSGTSAGPRISSMQDGRKL